MSAPSSNVVKLSYREKVSVAAMNSTFNSINMNQRRRGLVIDDGNPGPPNSPLAIVGNELIFILLRLQFYRTDYNQQLNNKL